MKILQNSAVVALWTAVSRALGFARDLMIANVLGAGMASDAFFIAFQLPNLFRRLLGEGAFNVAFVPIFAREKAKSDAQALVFAGAVYGWLTVILLGLTVVGLVLMPQLVSVMVPGWLKDPAKFQLTVELGRITFPYLMLICLASFYGAICNTYQKFAAYALAPVLLNISYLVCIYALPPLGFDAARAVAWSVPVGGVLQLAFMAWAVQKLGIPLTFGWQALKEGHPGLKPMLYRMGPAALGVGVLQVSLVLDNFLASWVGEGAVSYLQYANRFYQLPLALIGIAVATVLLPHLALLFGQGNKAEASKSFAETLVGCLTLAAGATVSLFLLAPEMMETLLQHGAFTPEAAMATAWAMMAFVLGLPGYIMTKVTAPVFFASEDPSSPVKASALALIVNFVLNVAFVLLCKQMQWHGVAHIGIALSTAIGGAVNAALQWHWLRQRGVLVIDTGPLKQAVGRMVLVGGALALVIIGLKELLPCNPAWPLALRLAWLGLAFGLGIGVFAAGAEGTGLVNLRDFYRQAKAARAQRGQLKAVMKATAGGEDA